MGNDPDNLSNCMMQFCELFCNYIEEENAPIELIQDVIDAGVVPRFVEFLQRDDDPKLQVEAEWVLANIISGISDRIKVVMEFGAVPIFVRLLLSPNDNVREGAVWALGELIYI